MVLLESNRQPNNVRQENHHYRLKWVVAARGLRPLMKLQGGLDPADQQCSLRRLEARYGVIFMPDVAYYNERGDVVAALQAWVYRNRHRRRLSHMLALMCGIDITALDEETRQTFYARTRLFMVDSDVGCKIHIRDEQGNQHILPATRSDGRTHERVVLPTQARYVKSSRKINFQLDEINHPTLLPPHCEEITCFFAPPHGISIISDIDDTIKQSFVGNKKKLLRTTFLEEYRPVPEMNSWYQHLAKTTAAAFHYVSSSPIQLYPALHDFMQTQHYPEGSIHLRETTRLREVLARPNRSKQHKRTIITRLLHSFKQRRFILIGDSGGDDALIYAEFAKQYPQQIAAICIRNVTPSSRLRLYQKIFADIAPDRWLVSSQVSTMRQFIDSLEIIRYD